MTNQNAQQVLKKVAAENPAFQGIVFNDNQGYRGSDVSVFKAIIFAASEMNPRLFMTYHYQPSEYQAGANSYRVWTEIPEGFMAGKRPDWNSSTGICELFTDLSESTVMSELHSAYMGEYLSLQKSKDQPNDTRKKLFTIERYAKKEEVK